MNSTAEMATCTKYVYIYQQKCVQTLPRHHHSDWEVRVIAKVDLPSRPVIKERIFQVLSCFYMKYLV